MANLLTLAQQQAIKPINYTADETEYDFSVQDKEMLYLEPLLGLALLQDLQDNPTTPENIELLDGGTYTDCQGNVVKQVGVRVVLAYFFYGDYIIEAGEQMTFTGYDRKERADSRDVGQGAKDNRKSAAHKIAYKYWEGVRLFLNENHTIYPLWNDCLSRKPRRAKILRGI